MRSALLLMLLALAAPAAAQPSSAPPPPQAQPPPPPPPAQPRRVQRNPHLTFMFGFGPAMVAFDAEDGPCPGCDHVPIAMAPHVGGGLRLHSMLAIVAELQIYYQFVDGLEGGNGRLIEYGGFVDAVFGLAPKLQLLGGAGYVSTKYAYDEPGIFGSSQVDVSIGSGPALLGGARYHLWTPPQNAADLGLEARMVIAKVEDVATPVVHVGVEFVVGWF